MALRPAATASGSADDRLELGAAVLEDDHAFSASGPAACRRARSTNPTGGAAKDVWMPIQSRRRIFANRLVQALEEVEHGLHRETGHAVHGPAVVAVVVTAPHGLVLAAVV
jgi:hypothetical protein